MQAKKELAAVRTQLDELTAAAGSLETEIADLETKLIDGGTTLPELQAKRSAASSLRETIASLRSREAGLVETVASKDAESRKAAEVEALGEAARRAVDGLAAYHKLVADGSEVLRGIGQRLAETKVDIQSNRREARRLKDLHPDVAAGLTPEQWRSVVEDKFRAPGSEFSSALSDIEGRALAAIQKEERSRARSA